MTAAGKLSVAIAALLFQITTATMAATRGDLQGGVKSESVMVGSLTVDMPEGRSSGTAFLIGWCEILSANHVVFGPWYVSALRPPSHATRGVFTLTEVTLPDGSHPHAVATPVMWGDYRGPDRQFRRPNEDWVVLTLDKCFGSIYGFFTPADPSIFEGASEVNGLSAIGYSSGRQKADNNCSLLKPHRLGQDDRFIHNCSAMHGDSGGPIFERSSNKVVAITSGLGGSSADPRSKDGVTGRANTAVPLSLGIIRKIGVAVVAAETQHILIQLGYRPGQIGEIESPAFRDTVSALQRKIGMPITGEPTIALVDMLYLLHLTKK